MEHYEWVIDTLITIAYVITIVEREQRKASRLGGIIYNHNQSIKHSIKVLDLNSLSET